MSTLFGTRLLLFAVLVILNTSVLALPANEHTKGEPITQLENEGSSGIAQDGRGKRAANIKIGLTSKINFRQRLQNDENDKTLQQKLQDGTDIRDCQDAQKQQGKGRRKSGVFTITPTGWKPIQVYCDMKTDGGGWTVFQRRFDGTENFDRKWDDYKSGFGKRNKEYWLGNENIHRISAQGNYKLRINLEDFDGNQRYAEFGDFTVSNERDKYRLRFGSYSGNAGTGYFELLNKMKFSTKNNGPNSKCAKQTKSGWWATSNCKESPNLNPLYGSKQKTGPLDFKWFGKWGGKESVTHALKSTTMMIKRVIKHP